MARGLGRRNILKELSSLDDGGTNISNSSFPLTPPSPDESLIQQRGHQRKSATYKFGAPDPVFFKSPTKSSPKKNVFQRLSIPTRSSPRKKLNLTPEKQQQIEAGPSGLNNNLGKRRLSLQNLKHSVDIEKNIKSLSHAQLVQLINDATKLSPFIKETMSSLVPEPDLLPIEERLHVLQRNVLKTHPRNVWGNQDSSFCFLRVRAHLEAFKKECLDYGRQFMDSQHWPSVFEYILIAWKLTLGLPDWTAVAHNKVKSACIKYLSAQCVTAFKKSSIDKVSLNEIIQRLEELGDDSDVKSCVIYARNLRKPD